MSFNKTETKLLSRLAKAGLANAEAMHAVGVYAIKKAYAGSTEFAQAAYESVRVKDRREFCTFLKRGGINVTDMGRNVFSIGKVLDQSKQREKIEWAQNAISFFIPEVKPEDREYTKPEDTRPASTVAQKAIEGVLKRVEKDRPDAAMVIRASLNAPEWLGSLMDAGVSDVEVAWMLTQLEEHRAANASRGNRKPKTEQPAVH